MLQRIKRAVTIALIATTLSACTLGLGPAIPDRVRPTLDGWQAIGLTCTGPTKDNVPSGLVQWSCLGALDGVELSGVFEGDDLGVFDLQAVVPAATPPDAARDSFARLIDATPPLDGLESEIVAFIDGWPGINTIGSFGPARVRVDVDDTWRALSISPGPRRNVDDPIS